jgi:hypothetical protein
MQTPVVSRYSTPAPVHDFILLFLTRSPLATGSLEPSLLVLHSSEAPQGKDLLLPRFTCTNADQAATCTCNTRPIVSPHHVVSHSSQPGATIHRSSDALVLTWSPGANNTHPHSFIQWRVTRSDPPCPHLLPSHLRRNPFVGFCRCRHHHL